MYVGTPKLAQCILIIIDVPVLVHIKSTVHDACQASVYIILTVICLKKIIYIYLLKKNKNKNKMIIINNFEN